ncbi:PQQ-binding-like beta-propeller repeat protein [Catenuloplanes japonicus]|uniref:PQQ-binding-like beta-propeller repeat protein n=1 Tax=Catenuloplanes japonicus TaxID=33876 RepID=UPI000525C389|nr:PQQ-binding-like beta-propeller repeat protein [Catenuloplanes japonicus]
MLQEAEKKSRAVWWQAAVAAVVLLVLGVVAGIRVLGPAEVLTVTTSTNGRPIPRVAGTAGLLYWAPLIAGNARVFAGDRLVRVDVPYNGTTERTPSWSLRRWPQSLLGVVTSGELVISRWSDGDLVAINGGDGSRAWRATGPESAPDAGTPRERRTNEQLTWTPPDLYTADDSAGVPLVVVRGESSVRVYEARTGTERPQIEADCGPKSFTTADGRFACQTSAGLSVYNLAGGAKYDWAYADKFKADSCFLGASRCGLVREDKAKGKAYRFTDTAVVATPQADVEGARVWGDVVFTTDGARTATATNMETGAVVWTWPGREYDKKLRVLAVQKDRVHLINLDNRMVTLDQATGAQISLFAFGVPISKSTGEELHWTPGPAYAQDNLVVAVRRRVNASYLSPDDGYYFMHEAVAVGITE